MDALDKFTQNILDETSFNGLDAGRGCWLFDAQARNSAGAIRLKSDGPYFKKFFDPDIGLGAKCNIISADFIEETGVVPFCVETNKSRGRKYPLIGPPTEVAAEQVGHTGQVRFTWKAPLSTEWLHHYEVLANGEWIDVGSSAMSFIHESISVGTFTYKVRCADQFLRYSEESAEVAVQVQEISGPTAPDQPGIPVASEITTRSATLTWAPSEGDNVRYRIALNGFPIAQTTQTHFKFINLRNFTEYRIDVRAFNDIGASRPSSETFKTLLSPPVNLRFSHFNGVCRLAWDPVFWHFPNHQITINGRIVDTTPGRWGYYFMRSDFSSGPAPHHFKFEVVAQLDGATSQVSKFEATLADGTPPTQPGAPVVSEITESSVKISWAPSDDSVGVTGYRVALNFFFVYNASDSHITISQLYPGTHYYVWVCALDKAGNLSSASPIAFFKTTGQAPRLPPPAPQAHITEATSTSALLNLSYPASEVGEEIPTGMRILINGDYHSNVLSGFKVLRLTDLKPNREHIIELRSFGLIGQLSEPTTLVHVPKDITPPSVPGNLRQTDSPPGSVTLEWDAATDDVEVAGYAFHNNGVFFGQTSLLSYTATGLIPGPHTFNVYALDSSGNTSEAASIVADIKAPAPSAPSNFRYIPTGLIPTLEWDPPAEQVSKYTISLTTPGGTVLRYESAQPFFKPVLASPGTYKVQIIAHNDEGSSLSLDDEFTTI